jgi:septum formation inhibitor MinC
MNKMLERVRTHLYENRKAYIAVAAGLAVGSVVTLLVIKYKVNAVIESDQGKIVQQINQIAWHPENNQMIVNLVEKSTPSKPVHLVGTNLFFNSLSEAARETGHTVTQISKNVNGHITDINGEVFELLERA